MESRLDTPERHSRSHPAQAATRRIHRFEAFLVSIALLELLPLAARGSEGSTDIAAQAGSGAGSGEQVAVEAAAWWTGSLLSASPEPMPVGHWLIEPYAIESRNDATFGGDGTRTSSPHAEGIWTESYLMYGLSKRVSIGMQPRATLRTHDAMRPNGGAVAGDLTAMVLLSLNRRSEGSWRPATALVMSETLPTGRFDRLNDRAGSGSGAGVHRTDLGFYAQSLGVPLAEHPLRVRVNLTLGWSDRAVLDDESVYGTPHGFRGEASPGPLLVADLAVELNLSRHWAFALDLAHKRQGRTLVRGRIGGSPLPVLIKVPMSESWALAPALEYNFTAYTGLIAGFRETLAGRNAAAMRTAAVALNLYL